MSRALLYNKLSNILLMAVIAIGMLFILWGVYPYRVAEIKSPAEVITKELRVGDNLQYHLEGTVYNAFEIVEIRRRMTNGVDYTMHETHPPTPEKGKIDTMVGSNEIPNVLPGMYQMEFTAIHKVNPIRNVGIQWYTEHFEVIK